MNNFKTKKRIIIFIYNISDSQFKNDQFITVHYVDIGIVTEKRTG